MTAHTDRAPFADIAAERDLLALVLYGQEPGPLARVQPADFGDTLHGTAWHLLQLQHAAGRDLDAVALADSLPAGVVADGQGWVVGLGSLYVTAANWESVSTRVVNAARRRRLGSLAERLSAAAGDRGLDLAQLAAGFRDELADIVTPGAGKLPRLWTGRDFLVSDLPALEPILDGLLCRGLKAEVVGASKSRKSFLVLQLALAVAGGLPFLRWRVPVRRRVLLIQAEIPEAAYLPRFRRMVNAFGYGPADLDGLRFMHSRGFATVLENPALVSMVREEGIELVVVDPPYKFLAGDENKAEDVKPTLALLDRFCRDTGAAVLFVHHNGKGNAGDRQAVDRGAGSGVIARDYDAALTIVPHADHTEARELYVVESLARCHAPTPSFTIVWDAEAGLFRVADEAPEARTSATVQRTGRQARPSLPPDSEVVALVQAGPVTVGEFLESLAGLGFGRDPARATKDRLVRTGVLSAWRLPGFRGQYMIGFPGHAPKPAKPADEPAPLEPHP